MTLWDWMCGDRDLADHETDACQSCGAPLPEDDYEIETLTLRPKAIGLCLACAEENLPALCCWCNSALGHNGAPNGFGDAICDDCLATYHRDRYWHWRHRFAWEDHGTDEYERRMASPETERLRLLAEAEESAGGDRDRMYEAEARYGLQSLASS